MMVSSSFCAQFVLNALFSCGADYSIEWSCIVLKNRFFNREADECFPNLVWWASPSWSSWISRFYTNWQDNFGPVCWFFRTARGISCTALPWVLWVHYEVPATHLNQQWGC
jgi:hypothetical protein